MTAQGSMCKNKDNKRRGHHGPHHVETEPGGHNERRIEKVKKKTASRWSCKAAVMETQRQGISPASIIAPAFGKFQHDMKQKIRKHRKLLEFYGGLFLW